MVRDFDDDGLISERELIVDPTQHAERTTEEETLAQTAPKAATLIWIGARNDQLPAPAAAIVRRYDRDGDGKLLVVGAGESVEMNLSAEAVRRLDANGDGLLDAAELEPLRHRADRNPPSLGFWHSRFGGPGVCGAARQVERTCGCARRSTAASRSMSTTPRSTSTATIAIRSKTAASNCASPASTSTRADISTSRNRGPIRSSPRPSTEWTPTATARWCASEFQGYVEIQNASAAARLRLEVIDRGQDLFSVVDANGDGLLTPRELAEAVELIETEDRNGDGLLSGMEIPARWSLNVARGSSRQVDARPVRLRVRAQAIGRRRGRAGLVSQDGPQSRRRRRCRANISARPPIFRPPTKTATA